MTCFYNGSGTREDGETIPLVGELIVSTRRLVNSALAPSWGDARRVLKQAAGDLEELWPTSNDRIVLFGFSRGAALARKFASIVLGAHPELGMAFLGVFDTVAAMDGIQTRDDTISTDVVFESGTLRPSIRRAVHIVAMDEDRVAFQPTLINRDVKNPDCIMEVWFPGVHSDIGGGYWHDGLSDVSLTFMIEKCRKALRQDINIANSTSAEIGRLLREQAEILRLLDVDDIMVHPNVTGTVHRHTARTGKIYPKEMRQVCVRDNDQVLDADVCRTLVHHSVKAPCDLVAEYRPTALRGIKFNVLLPDGSEKSVTGISGQREHQDRREREEELSG